MFLPSFSQVGEQSYMINTWESIRVSHRPSLPMEIPVEGATWRNYTCVPSPCADAARALETHTPVELVCVGGTPGCDSTHRVEVIGPGCEQIMLIRAGEAYWWLRLKHPEQVFLLRNEGGETRLCLSDKEAKTHRPAQSSKFLVERAIPRS